jgi:hypothetical protein
VVEGDHAFSNLNHAEPASARVLLQLDAGLAQIDVLSRKSAHSSFVSFVLSPPATRLRGRIARFIAAR